MTDEIVVPANGIELCYQTFGDPTDEPLLLVMGLGAQMISWPIGLIEALVDRGFFVVRYDNRDVGRSTKLGSPDEDLTPQLLAAIQGEPIEAPYLLTDLAADAVALLDVLGIGSAHVVGASMGGMIAQALAIEHPDRVRTLTSIMSSTGEPDVGQPDPAAMAVLLRPPVTTRDEAIEAGLVTWEVITGPEHFDAERVRREVGEAFDRCHRPDGRMRQLLAILASGSRADGLRALDVPTLVIHGDADPLVTPSGGARTAELVPGATLLVVEGMGHDLAPFHLPQIVDAITALVSRSAATSA